ncbi:unnamed protein product, partial [Candidula unifasciata]
MTESLVIPYSDTKNTKGRDVDDCKISYKSRFKIMTSGVGPPTTRFGGFDITEMAASNSAVAIDERMQRRRQQGEDSTHHISSNPSKSSRSSNSLYKIASERRSRRVKLYRNGDRFFKGMLYAVSSERFRTFESLLTALTSTAVCDKRVMPNGVRHIFSLDGNRRLHSVEELREGESYVCASGNSFRAIDYSKIEDAVWNSCMFPEHGSNRSLNKKTQNKTAETSSSQNSETFSTSSLQSQPRPESARDKCATSVRDRRTCRSHSYKSDTSGSERKGNEHLQTTIVSPRLVTLVRNGRKPRKVFRFLLNKKTAKSFEQVMTDIAEMVNYDCGQAKRVYTISGQQVMCLGDFFQNDTVFLVCAQDKPKAEDFHLDSDESRQTQVRRLSAGKDRERTTRKVSSPASIKSSRSSMSTSKDVSQKNTRRPHSDGDSPQQKADKKTVNKEHIESCVSSLPMPKVLTNKYEVGRPIGTGNFAVVMECRDRKTKRKYALKIINKDLCKGKPSLPGRPKCLMWLSCPPPPPLYTISHLFIYIFCNLRQC